MVNRFLGGGGRAEGEKGQEGTKQYSPCFYENVAGRRHALFFHLVVLLFFSQKKGQKTNTNFGQSRFRQSRPNKDGQSRSIFFWAKVGLAKVGIGNQDGQSLAKVGISHLRTHMRPSMPLIVGSLGVGGCSRIRHAAHWGSWADCLEMVKDRDPQVAEDITMDVAHGSFGRWVEATTKGMGAGALPSRPRVAEIRFTGGARTPPRQCGCGPNCLPMSGPWLDRKVAH